MSGRASEKPQSGYPAPGERLELMTFWIWRSDNDWYTFSLRWAAYWANRNTFLDLMLCTRESCATFWILIGIPVAWEYKDISKFKYQRPSWSVKKLLS
jgi:hypothetical protein